MTDSKQTIKYIEVSEKELEDLIRKYPTHIEEGLRYIGHQRITDRGPLDVLLVDSGNSLVLSELKIIEDDSMLVQGIDYYDYIVRNIEGISRIYNSFNVDPKQTVRLMLIAPSFSVNLLNRCKWVDIPISLYTYRCIIVNDSKESVPVFTEISIPSIPETIEDYNINDRFNYITDKNAKKLFESFLNEIKEIDSTNIKIEPTKYDISLKIKGRVFAYACPRRSFFVIYTNNNENKWTPYAVNLSNDLENLRILIKNNIDKLG